MNSFLLITIVLASQTLQLLPSKPGSFHSPPSSAYIGEELVLEWKQVIRGYQGAGAKRRYSDERVYYRIRGNAAYKEATVVRTAATPQFVIIKAMIPAVHARDGVVLEYYHTCKLDGNQVHSKHGPDSPRTIPVKRGVSF